MRPVRVFHHMLRLHRRRHGYAGADHPCAFLSGPTFAKELMQGASHVVVHRLFVRVPVLAWRGVVPRVYGERHNVQDSHRLLLLHPTARN